MPANVEGILFGRLAIGKGFISEETLYSCLKTCQKSSGDGQNPVSLQEVLVREGHLSPDQLNEIQQVLQHVVREDRITGYDIHRKVQNTEYGAVYRASQLSLNRPVNILVLFRLAIPDRDVIHRFDTEARTLSGLNHRGVIQGIDVGEVEDLWFFVMEHVEGQSLSELVDQQGTIDESDALDFILQTARALRALEESGLEHGDINPDHIMINQDGMTKLTGFPLARRDQRRQRLEAGVFPVNLHYRSPEYVRNEEIDVRTDLYALGASIYYAVTGHKPFQDMEAADIVERNSSSRPVEPVLVHRPGMKSGLSAVIEKMMLPDPECRYGDPEALIEDVELISEGSTPEHVRVRDHLRQYQLVRDSSTDRQPSYLDMIFSQLVEDARIQVAVAVFALILVVFSYLEFSTTDPVPTADQSAGVVVNESDETKEEASDPDRSSNQTGTTSGNSTDEENNTSPEQSSSSGSESVFTRDSEPSQPDSPQEQTPGPEQNQKQQEDRERESPQNPPLRDRYLRMKASVDQFDGGLSGVQELVSQIENLRKQTESRDLRSDLRQLRSRFLSEQADQILNRRIEMEEVGQAGIERLATVYQKLDSFPQIFRETFTWNVVQKRKGVVRDEIEQRIEHLKSTLLESMNKQSFSDTDQSFEELQYIASSETLSAFVDDWPSLRTEYLKKRSAHERELVRDGVRVFNEFKTEFWKTYDLSAKSIVSISDQQARKLIEEYPSRVGLETIQKKIQMFGEDLNTLRLYREMLRSNLEKMFNSDRRLERLVVKPGETGELEGFSDGALQVKSRGSTEERSLSEYPISHRVALARWDRDPLNKREVFALGLASFLGGDLELAQLWLSEARERRVSRAELYLDEISRRTRSPREQKVEEFVELLKLAQSEGLRDALARIVLRLSYYDDTELYQQNMGFINQVRSDLPYDPETFLDSSDLREDQEQLERILTVYRTWFAGRVERGPDLKTVQFTYNFQNSEELSDWSNTNGNGLRSNYLESQNALRLSGEGLFLHDLSLTGQVTLQVELQAPEPIEDTGAVLLWRQKRGYRGMLNWTPLGKAEAYPAMGSTVLQKFQLPRSGNPGFSNTRLLTMESVSSSTESDRQTTKFQMKHREERIELSKDGQDVITASDNQFKRGRSGLIFEGARRNIARIQVSGEPDRKWINRKLESLGTTMDQIISEQSSSTGGKKGATSGQGGDSKQGSDSSSGGEDKSSSTGTADERDQSGTDSSMGSPLAFQDVEPGAVAFAVNYGGKQVTEEGQTFIGDPFPDRGRDTKPGTISTNQRGSPPGSLNEVFRSDRFGKDMTFVFPLANGSYNVEFFFVEDWWNKPDSRIFDVFLQGEKVFEQLDVYQETGKRHKGIRRTIKGVQVRDRRMKLRMSASEDNANIAGLVIKRVE